MRIYLIPSPTGYGAVAPEVPGTWTHAADREEAAEACRSRVAEELAAYERMGSPLPVSAGEQVVLWEASGLATLPEEFEPPDREYVRAAVRRIQDVRHELARFLDSLSPAAWERRPEGEWNVRTVLDHVANSQWLTVGRLEPWPLHPLQAQAEALEDLYGRLCTLAPEQQTGVTEHFGLNRENGRVHWTPRKVLRAVRVQQEAWLAHLRAGGAEPAFPQHGDAADDAEPPSPAEVRALRERGRELVAACGGHPTAPGWLAVLYRYYRDRLIRWPSDPRARWDAVWEHTRDTLLGLSDTDVALVRVLPTGREFGTVRQVLNLSLSHLWEHFGQMRRTAEQTAAPRPAGDDSPD